MWLHPDTSYLPLQLCCFASQLCFQFSAFFPFLGHILPYSKNFARFSLQLSCLLPSAPECQLFFAVILPGFPGTLQCFQAYRLSHSSHYPFLSPIPLRDFIRNIFGKALYIILIFNFLEKVYVNSICVVSSLFLPNLVFNKSLLSEFQLLFK